MHGEFRGDFTRDTFNARNHFLRVLMQQGRVQLDADWNEQIAILLDYLQTLAEDLIGSHGGPTRRLGFGIAVEPLGKRSDKSITDFSISPGHYYVNGTLCRNDKLGSTGSYVPISYFDQDDYPLDREEDTLPDFPFLVYLDVWENHVNYLQIDHLREVALNGRDTATRSRIIWQVKTHPLQEAVVSCETVDQQWLDLVQQWQPTYRGLLKAQAYITNPSTDPCTISPESRFRGMENQLYRVEIHQGGTSETATFKWSRENSSVVFPIAPDSIPPRGNQAIVRLTQGWFEDALGLKAGDWVEIVDDDTTLQRWADPEPLWKVNKIEVDGTDILVSLSRQNEDDLKAGQSSDRHPLLRRWDQKQTAATTLEPDGTIKVQDILEGSESPWLMLEDGIQIQFQPSPSGDSHVYRAGDYWLIPARTATGNVEWPQLNDRPVALPPHGIHHHYAPLALIVDAGSKKNSSFTVHDCRRQFYSLARTYYYVGEGKGIGSELLWTDEE